MHELKLDEMISMGEDHGRGNLLGIQPVMGPGDYASGAAFETKLGAYLEAARGKSWLNERSVAVFPEYTGTWLVAAGEGQSVLQAATLQAAMLRLALAHPLALARTLISAAEKDRLAASLFRVKARAMAESYTRAFSSLAKTLGATIVAGSILLPGAIVRAGKVTAGRGRLENVSAVFGPDGLAHPDLARKCFPIRDELPFLAPARVQDLPVFNTPAGRFGVLVCADSWYPQAYAALKERDIQLLAVPSYINHSGAWDIPWGGYSGWPSPGDVDPTDVGRLSEGQAWGKYALGGRLAASGARYGVNVFLQGALWDLGSDGRSVIMAAEPTPVRCETQSSGAALLNLWL